MTVRRAKTTVNDVSTVAKALIERDFKAAAKSNGVLSKVEQKEARAYVRAAADEVRKQQPGKHVQLDELAAQVAPRTQALMSEFNQPAGAGANLLSKAEANAAFKKDPVYGELVLEAYEIASGNGLDVDALALAKVERSLGLDPGEQITVYPTLHEAERSSGGWLVRLDDGLLKNKYVYGKNDLWHAEFDVDRLTGEISVTREH
ncbi:MAG: hypothetical protein JNK82_26605 [Myxococcaceae bacterium]|nr:hypothetical protein [Myxococcaceae bacterium]